MKIIALLFIFIGLAFGCNDIVGELLGPFESLNEPVPGILRYLPLLAGCFCFALCLFNPVKHVKCFQSTWTQVTVLAMISWVVMGMPLYIVQRYVASKLDSIKVNKNIETADDHKRLEDALGFKICVRHTNEGQTILFTKKPGRLVKVQQIIEAMPPRKTDK